MGYRNPVTTAAAVNTAAGPGQGGVSLYSTTSSGGGGAPLVAGVVDFDDGFPADTHATITRTAQQQRSDLVGSSSGALSVAGGSVGGGVLPTLDLAVLDSFGALPPGAEAHLYVPGGTLKRFRVDGPVQVPQGTLAAVPGIPGDAAPYLLSGSAVLTLNGAGQGRIGYGPFPNGALTVLAWPGDTASNLNAVQAQGYDVTGFSLRGTTPAGALCVGVVRVNWLAIGY